MGLNSKRLIFLDSVKGLAAFCVLTGHFYMLFQQSMPETVQVIERIPVANLIVNGRYAVCLFVVISNYIFAKNIYEHFDMSSLQLRLLKRYFRLAIPIAFIVAAVCIMYYAGLFHTGDLSNGKLHKFWNGLSISTFLKQAIFSPLGYSKVLGPCWMLKYIFLGNLYIVLLAIITSGKSLKAQILIYTIACILSLYFSMEWICVFTGGLLYVLEKSQIMLKRGAAMCLIASTVVAALPESVFSGNIGYYCIAANLMLWGILMLPKIQSLLSNSIFVFLGKQSLAIYLVHWPILCSLSCWLYITISNEWSLVLNLGMTVIITLIISVIYSRYVERWADYIVSKIVDFLK